MTDKVKEQILAVIMKWDNGCGLNVVYGEDIVRKAVPGDE